MQTSKNARLIAIREVKRLTSLSSSSIYRHMAEGSFPQNFEISLGRTAWREEDVLAWIESKIRAKD